MHRSSHRPCVCRTRCRRFMWSQIAISEIPLRRRALTESWSAKRSTGAVAACSKENRRQTMLSRENRNAHQEAACFSRTTTIEDRGNHCCHCPIVSGPPGRCCPCRQRCFESCGSARKRSRGFLPMTSRWRKPQNRSNTSLHHSISPCELVMNRASALILIALSIDAL